MGECVSSLDTESSSLRVIVHFYHNIRDEKQPDGVLDEVCLDDLRRGLCEVGVDFFNHTLAKKKCWQSSGTVDLPWRVLLEIASRSS
jgi:hypothetical protein